MRVAKSVFAWLALAGFLSLCLFSFVLSEDQTVEAQASAWDQPVYQDGRWRLEGITEPGVESQTSPWGRLDLVRVRYGRGEFWSVAGLTDEHGNFESWVEGVSATSSCWRPSASRARLSFRSPVPSKASFPPIAAAVFRRPVQCSLRSNEARWLPIWRAQMGDRFRRAAS